MSLTVLTDDGTRAPYATVLREALAGMRRADPKRSFDSAYGEALRTHRPPEGWSGVLSETRAAWKRAYEHEGTGSLSALADRERGVPVDFSQQSPVSQHWRCGYGGGCTKARREGGYLCEEHGEEIRAAFRRAEHTSRAEVFYRKLGTAQVAA